MLAFFISAGLRLLSLAGSIFGWFTGDRDRQQGREEQQNADLRTTVDVLRKQRDSLAQPVTDKDVEQAFDKGEF